ncbi:MAG: DUF2927 domain-containing protein [Rhodobacteraceae bacterium]|nr:DUF2927 domain-containing protein [Paracoccaceae bacterium]
MLLAACAAPPLSELPTRADPLPDTLPPMNAFGARTPSSMAGRANADIARDFLELAFEMESGRELDRLTRFEGRITVALAAPGPKQFEADLAALLARFRAEAGLDIVQATTGAPANIVIVTLPRRKLQATVPHAACFVVPRVTSWDDFRQNRRSGALDWSTLERRDRATVFIPDDVSPQEARDCLHEEIAQALGPLNDLYRLADSVYNDDNINTVLTGFDMLILRVFYDNALDNGMSRAAVAERLPGILARLNPGGEAVARDGITTTPRAWIDAIEAALGPRVAQARRLTSARRAVAIARSEEWVDNRLGFSLYAQGRLALGVDGDLSADSFRRAYALYSELFGTDDIHTAHVALQLAAFALSAGEPDLSLRYVNESLPSVSRAENAALLATFLMIKAEALDQSGRHSEAATVRLDSLGWARYGFASDDEIRARLREIAALRSAIRQTEA